MTSRVFGAAEFKAKCLNIIERMHDDGQPVIVTRRGKPVALVTPVGEDVARNTSIIGAMKGTVLVYDDPFAPATPSDDWAAAQ